MTSISRQQPGQSTANVQRAELYGRAIGDAFVKLDPRRMVRNPVMFVVEVGSVLTTLLFLQALTGRGEAPAGFIGAVALWLWFTVLFANFSEALAEGRGKAQAEALRRTRHQTQAMQLPKGPAYAGLKLAPAGSTLVSSDKLRPWRRRPCAVWRHHPG